VFAEEFDVADEIDRVLEGIDHPVAVELGTGDARVLADPRRTRQILRNLVSNAVRYGGDVIKVETERTDGSVQVRVCDNGEPLDAEEADRIFLAFQQGSGRRADSKSVGLGLSVARTLADLMDGKLVYHHDGEFSSFIVTLPAAP
jgi:signal transduction histidine kinase